MYQKKLHNIAIDVTFIISQCPLNTLLSINVFIGWNMMILGPGNGVLIVTMLTC